MKKNCLYCGIEFETRFERVGCCCASHGQLNRSKVDRGPVRYTFEELFDLYDRWARRYGKGKYDYWELISEAWLCGRAKYAKNRRHASNNIRCAMIDYMRRVEGRRGTHRNEGFQKIFRSLSLDTEYKEDVNFYSSLEAGSKPDLEHLFRNLSRREALSVKLRFFGGFKIYEIPKITGYSTAFYFTGMIKLRGLKDFAA